jgi:RimJ/RimL family protein N-acetyltransferase
LRDGLVNGRRDLVATASQPHGSDTVEITYGVAPAWRGRGLATEMLTGVTRVARDQDADRRLELIIDGKNAASIRVAEKSGYQLAGTRRSVVEATGETYEDLVYVPAWQMNSSRSAGCDTPQWGRSM